MNAKTFRDMQVQTRGEFGGLGIEVTQENGYIKVISPIDETPASRAGMKAGDLILALDGKTVQGLSLNDAVDKMRGPTGSKIKLTIKRDGVDKPIELTMQREVIKIQVVKSHLEGDIGYIRISQLQRADRQRSAQGVPASSSCRPTTTCAAWSRPAQQPRRPARPGGRGIGRLHPPGRDRLDARAPSRGKPALECQGRRHHRRSAARRADQRRLRLGQRDRRRRAAGSSARRSFSARAASAKARCRP